MKSLYVLLFLLPVCLSAQITTSLVPSVSAAQYNDVNSAAAGLLLRFEGRAPDGVLRFQTGYRAWFNEADRFKKQSVHLDGMAGVLAADWFRVLGGLSIVYQKEDWDGTERFEHRRKWITEFEYMAIAEADIGRMELATYLAIGVDGNYHGGLQLRAPIYLKK